MHENISEIRDAFYDYIVKATPEMPEEEMKALVDLFFKQAEARFSPGELAEKFESVEALVDLFSKFLKSQKW